MKKIGDSFKGVLGGIVFIIIGVILLWWNEGNNVKNIKTTDEMMKTVIDVKSDSVDEANEGKLIATNGKLVNEETLTDTTFGASIVTPKMVRTVEIYQWVEKEDTEDGNTTYSYTKEWSNSLIDSSSFHQNGHDNPKAKPYEDATKLATQVTVGAFKLSSDQIGMLSTEGVFVDYNAETLTTLGYHVAGNYITNSENYESPNVGDVRVIISYNNSTDVSILAVQTGNTFKDFVSSVGKTHNRVVDGIHSGSDIINMIVKENKIIKWALRLGGILLCIAGVCALFKPLSTLANFVPILGGIVDMAVGLVGLIVGLAISLVVIAIAWIRFRPLIGIALLVVVGALVFILIKKKKSKAAAAPVETTTPEAPKTEE